MENLRKEQSYFEVSYLDDDNTQHLTYLKQAEELTFVQERFTLLNYNLVQR